MSKKNESLVSGNGLWFGFRTAQDLGLGLRGLDLGLGLDNIFSLINDQSMGMVSDHLTIDKWLECIWIACIWHQLFLKCKFFIMAQSIIKAQVCHGFRWLKSNKSCLFQIFYVPAKYHQKMKCDSWTERYHPNHEKFGTVLKMLFKWHKKWHVKQCIFGVF